MVVSDALPVQFWSVDTDTYNEREPEGVFRKCFCHPFENSDLIRVQFDFRINDTFTLRVYDADETLLQTIAFINTLSTVYTVSFTPSDYAIEDEVISLKIFQGSIERFKSDCIELKETWEETVLITYSDNKNFASLNYSLVSPDPEFYIRIPAVFEHSRFPQESEQLELSSSRMIALNSMIKAQKRLETAPMPAHMHRKMILVLHHQFVEIGNQGWVKEEAYEIQDPPNRRVAMKKANVWLTEKDYFIRNVL